MKKEKNPGAAPMPEPEIYTVYGPPAMPDGMQSSFEETASAMQEQMVSLIYGPPSMLRAQSNDGCCIREWTEADLPEMLEIWNAVVAAGDAFPQEEPLTPETGRAFFAQQTYTGVAEEDGCLQGLYILHPNNVGRCGHICNASYAVRSSARGQGIGKQLVLDCLEQGRAHGFRILQFNAVVESNLPARRLYEKLGFRQLGTIEGGFRMRDGAYVNICPYWIAL